MDDSDISRLHQALVDDLVQKGHITTPQVEAAFRAVPRHPFVPGVPFDEVYADRVIPTKILDGQLVSSSSQPAIMAIMLEQLGLEPGQRVLEIGAGTGYNAALLAHLVGDAGQVVTVDLEEDIVSGAREHLAAAGLKRVQVICADGGHGYAEAAPYDRIMLTVGSADIAPAWWQQLKTDGRLVMPLGIRGDLQLSVALEREEDHLISRSVRACGFMLLRGECAAKPAMRQMSLGPEPGLSLSVTAECATSVDVAAAVAAVAAVDAEAERVYTWLMGGHTDWTTGILVSDYEASFSLRLWLGLYEACAGTLAATGDMVERNLVPSLAGWDGAWKSVFTSVVLGKAGLAALTRPPGQAPSWRDPCGDESSDLAFELTVRQFGPDQGPARRLIELVRAWDMAGRPAAEAWRVRAYPAGSGYVPSEGETAVDKPCTRLVLDQRAA